MGLGETCRQWSAAVGVALLGAAALPAAAVDATWQSPGGGMWGDGANWDAGVPDAAGDRATFGPDAPVSASNITLADPVTLGDLRLDNPFRITLGGAAPLTFDTGSVGLNATLIITPASSAGHAINNPLSLVSDLDITQGSGGGLTLRGPLTGSGDLTLTGGGTLVLDQPRTNDNQNWSGNLFVNEGTLFIGVGGRGANALGDTTGGTTIAAGATLDLFGAGGSPIGEDITLSGLGVHGAGAIRYSRGGPAFLNGDLTLLGDAAIVSDNNTTGTLHIGLPDGSGTGSLSGDGRLIKLGGLRDGKPGPLQLNLHAAHTGGTDVREGFFVISQHGSLVDTGDVRVGPLGTLFVQPRRGGRRHAAQRRCSGASSSTAARWCYRAMSIRRACSTRARPAGDWSFRGRIIATSTCPRCWAVRTVPSDSRSPGGSRAAFLTARWSRVRSRWTPPRVTARSRPRAGWTSVGGCWTPTRSRVCGWWITGRSASRATTTFAGRWWSSRVGSAWPTSMRWA